MFFFSETIFDSFTSFFSVLYYFLIIFICLGVAVCFATRMWEVLAGRVVSPIPDWHFISSCYGRTENAQDQLKQTAAFIHLSYLLSKGGELCPACRHSSSVYIFVFVSLCVSVSFSLFSLSMRQHKYSTPPSLPPSIPSLSFPPSLRARTTGWRSTGRRRTIGPCRAT